jgi:hypothetical protein
VTPSTRAKVTSVSARGSAIPRSSRPHASTASSTRSASSPWVQPRSRRAAQSASEINRASFSRGSSRRFTAESVDRPG